MLIEEVLKLKQFRIKTPALNSNELDIVHAFIFNELKAGWATVISSHPYGQGLTVATNQDGYLYLMKFAGCWQVTADCAYPLIDMDVPIVDVIEIERFLKA